MDALDETNLSRLIPSLSLIRLDFIERIGSHDDSAAAAQTALPFLASAAFSFSVPFEEGQRGFAAAAAAAECGGAAVISVGGAVVISIMPPLSLLRPALMHDPKQTRNEDLNARGYKMRPRKRMSV